MTVIHNSDLSFCQYETDMSAALPISATILICSTVSPAFHKALPFRIAKAGRPDVKVIDCPVSGGTARAADGTLTIFASGEADTLERVGDLLRDMSEKLYVIPGGEGAASKMKMVNQLLVGTHIAAAAEAMALATKAGLNTREVYDIITNAAGNSWAFENRVPHMLNGDWTPHSALDIFVKDMVSSESRCMNALLASRRLISCFLFPPPGHSCVKCAKPSIPSTPGFGSRAIVHLRVVHGMWKRRRCRACPSFLARRTEWSHGKLAPYPP